MRLRLFRARSAAGTIALAAALGLCGCSDDPAQPPPGAALSGNVRLTARQTDLVGTTLADITEQTADGVAVTLRGSDGSERTTVTTAGRFRFAGLPPGRYVASVGIESATEVSSAEIELAQADVELAAPLALESTAGVMTFPNPFQTLPGLAIQCTTAAAGPIQFEVLSTAQVVVWSYATNSVAGLQHVHWIGDDSQQHEVPDGLYWVVVHKDAVTERSLVRKTSP